MVIGLEWLDSAQSSPVIGREGGVADSGEGNMKKRRQVGERCPFICPRTSRDAAGPENPRHSITVHRWLCSEGFTHTNEKAVLMIIYAITSGSGSRSLCRSIERYALGGLDVHVGPVGHCGLMVRV